MITVIKNFVQESIRWCRTALAVALFRHQQRMSTNAAYAAAVLRLLGALVDQFAGRLAPIGHAVVGVYGSAL